MKIRSVAATLLALFLVGCAVDDTVTPPKSTTTTIRRGRDFDTSKVKDIQKGKTTTQEIVQWLGQPSAKKIVSTNQVGWLYAWSQATTTINRTSHTAIGKQTGFKKKLDLLIADDVVVNYTFEEGPFEVTGDGKTK